MGSRMTRSVSKRTRPRMIRVRKRVRISSGISARATRKLATTWDRHRDRCKNPSGRTTRRMLAGCPTRRARSRKTGLKRSATRRRWKRTSWVRSWVWLKAARRTSRRHPSLSPGHSPQTTTRRPATGSCVSTVPLRSRSTIASWSWIRAVTSTIWSSTIRSLCWPQSIR